MQDWSCMRKPRCVATITLKPLTLTLRHPIPDKKGTKEIFTWLKEFHILHVRTLLHFDFVIQYTERGEENFYYLPPLFFAYDSR